METQNPSFSSLPYAHAGRLVASCLAAFLPPDRITTADYAATHRFLSNEGGGYVGRWMHDKAPYLVGIMDALDDTEHTTVAVPKPGQCGGTAIAENWLLKLVCTDPANLLWYMQTEPAMQAYVKGTINPMIATHSGMQGRQGTRRTDDSLGFKAFLGMSVEFLGATHSNLTNKKAGRIIADEFDGYDIGGADPKTLLDVRRSTFGLESKLFCLSHADKAEGNTPAEWNKGIMSLYRDSDRRVWWWACPHCSMFSSPNPGTRFTTTLEYDATLPLDEIAATAHLVCPHNGCVIADHERRAMNLTGRWVGLGQEIDAETGEVTGDLVKRDIAGFWIVGIMSPFVFGGIGGLAAALVKAERERDSTGDDASLRQVVVKQLGHGYRPLRAIGSVDAATLAARCEPDFALATVPSGVRFITCGIDVQANRFELIYRGFGVDRESWVIAHQIAGGVEPATDPAAWDQVLTAALEASFPLADGSGRHMKVRGVGVDTGGEAGVTSQAYDAWRRANRARRTRSIGIISGRRAWTLLPLKGGSAKGVRPLQIVLPEGRNDRFSGARGDVPVGLFAPNWHKDVLAAQLERAEFGPGYIHFPSGLLNQVGGIAKPPHPFFDQLTAERRRKDGQWEKISARNEVLDCMVMAGVTAHLFAPSRFDWTRPPPWARDWDHNPMVFVPAPASQNAPAVAPPAVRVQPPAAPPASLPRGMPSPPAIAAAGRRTVAQIIAGQLR
jgi:phage terminase large subunit GpA-like protein